LIVKVHLTIILGSLVLQATKPGGVFVIVGHGPNKVEFPVVSLVAKEIEIMGSFRYVNT